MSGDLYRSYSFVGKVAGSNTDRIVSTSRILHNDCIFLVFINTLISEI
jgi:hypothetical protein